MNVCLYVCMSVCLYVCMYVCMCINVKLIFDPITNCYLEHFDDGITRASQSTRVKVLTLKNLHDEREQRSEQVHIRMDGRQRNLRGVFEESANLRRKRFAKQEHKRCLDTVLCPHNILPKKYLKTMRMYRSDVSQPVIMYVIS